MASCTAAIQQAAQKDMAQCNVWQSYYGDGTPTSIAAGCSMPLIIESNSTQRRRLQQAGAIAVGFGGALFFLPEILPILVVALGGYVVGEGIGIIYNDFRNGVFFPGPVPGVGPPASTDTDPERPIPTPIPTPQQTPVDDNPTPRPFQPVPPPGSNTWQNPGKYPCGCPPNDILVPDPGTGLRCANENKQCCGAEGICCTGGINGPYCTVSIELCCANSNFG